MPKMFATTQLEIIRLFGNKDLSEGCLIQQGEYLMKIWCIYEGIFNMKEINSANCMQTKESELGEILGHIPELFPDVARVAEDKNKIRKFEMNVDRNTLGVLGLRFYEETDGWSKNRVVEGYNPTLPLIEQSESTLIELLQKFKS